MKQTLTIIIIAMFLAACGSQEQLSAATGTPTTQPTNPPTATSTPQPTNTSTPTPVLPFLEQTPIPFTSPIITEENADHMIELARWGKGTVEQVAYSPDGRSLAVATSLGIYFFDSQTFQEVKFIGTKNGVKCIAFSPDSALMVSGTKEGEVNLWQLSDGTLLRTYADHKDLVTSVAFSPDGASFVSGSLDQTVNLWNLSDDNPVASLYDEQWSSQVASVAFSPDGAFVAAATGGDNVLVWDVETQALVHAEANYRGGYGLRSSLVSPGRVYRMHFLAFSPDGEFLLSATVNGGASQWHTSNWEYARTHTWPVNEGEQVCSLAYSPDGKKIGTGWINGKIRIWDDTTNSNIGSFDGHRNWVCSIAFSPDSEFMASGSGDGTVKIWKTIDNELVATLQFDAYISSLSLTSDGTTIALGNSAGAVTLRNLSEGSVSLTILGASDHILPSMDLSADGELLAINAPNDTIQVWSVSDETLLSTSTLDGDVQSVSFSPDGTLLATGDSDYLVKLWSIDGGSLLRTIKDDTLFVPNVLFSHDNEILAVGDSNGTVFLWQTSDGELLRTMKIQETVTNFFGATNAGITQMAFSSDDEFLATSSVIGTVHLWKVSDGTLMNTLKPENPQDESPVFSPIGLAFSPDGTLLATGSNNKGVVHLWRVLDGKLIHTIEINDYLVTGLAFSPDGKLLYSGSFDGTVRVWGIMP